MFIQQTTNAEAGEEVIAAVANDFPDTAGNAVEAVDILILPDQTVKIYSHYQNGNLMVFAAPLSDMTEGDMIASDPAGYLEDSAAGKFIFSSRPLTRPLSLAEAKKIVEVLEGMEVL